MCTANQTLGEAAEALYSAVNYKGSQEPAMALDANEVREMRTWIDNGPRPDMVLQLGDKMVYVDLKVAHNPEDGHVQLEAYRATMPPLDSPTDGELRDLWLRHRMMVARMGTGTQMREWDGLSNYSRALFAEFIQEVLAS